MSMEQWTAAIYSELPDSWRAIAIQERVADPDWQYQRFRELNANLNASFELAGSYWMKWLRRARKVDSIQPANPRERLATKEEALMAIEAIQTALEGFGRGGSQQSLDGQCSSWCRAGRGHVRCCLQPGHAGRHVSVP